MKLTKDFLYNSAIELVSALANKKISSEELLDETIARIERYDKSINAMPVRDFEQARIAAKKADKLLAEGNKSPLLGLPISVKESFNVVGMPTTWGNPQYKNWMPQEDSLVVTRLKTAGANIIGKSNVSFMLGDWQSYNDVYGTTNNPYDIKRTPGGSSGGSAAALAAGFVALELGSDLAGSLRVPAHYCGIYAHKPTFNIVPLRGVRPPNNPARPGYFDFVVAGPMARTAADLALGLSILAGPDELMEGKGYQLSLPAPRHQQLKEFKVLIIDNDPTCPTADSIREAMTQLTERLAKAHVTIARHSPLLPDLAAISSTYHTLLAGFLSLNSPQSAYDEMRQFAQSLHENDTSALACHLRGSTFSHRDWLMLSRTKAQLFQAWHELYQSFDVVLCPAMPTPAFLHDHSDIEKRIIDIDGKKISYWQQMTWPSIATLFGLPSTVAPIGFTSTGLPIGVQIIGDYLEDYTTIQFAHLLEREFGGFVMNSTL